ncbi:MAG: hypothetical protein IJ594_03140, partial [Oscillospiraceae bacterium]|nr:hypothetical protein [Oscillospiraceae bacterium]
MTGERFFDAFGGIDPSYLLAVDEILARAEQRTVRPRRRVLRTLLIAAAIAALLTVTAYAAGLFGLQARLIRDGAPDAQTEDGMRRVYRRDYISLSGVTGSPEYRAAAEWLAFRGSYAQRQTDPGWRDLARSFAPDGRTREICRLYQVWDAAMWDELQHVAQRYGLRLHESRSPVPGDESQTRSHGQYEDGSCLVTVGAVVEGSFLRYELYLERAGSLPCDDMTASCADAYEEWEYRSASGQTVSIAMREIRQNESWVDLNYLIFYNGDGATLTVKAWWGRPADEGDGGDRAYAERLADGIDFAGAAAAATAEEAVALL